MYRGNVKVAPYSNLNGGLLVMFLLRPLSYTMPDCFSYRISSTQSDTKILAVTLLRSAYSYARYQEYTIF